MRRAALTFAALIALAGSAYAGDRYDYRQAAPQPPAPGGRYYGPVNNFYAPVTIYAGGYATYPSAAYSSSYPAYAPGYASAPPCDATCNGVGYDWSGGYGYSYGYGGGYAYPGYRYGYTGYPGVNGGAAMNPWAGYNSNYDNGYW